MKNQKHDFVQVTKHYGYLPFDGMMGCMTWYKVYEAPFSYVGDQIYNPLKTCLSRSRAREICRLFEKALKEKK